MSEKRRWGDRKDGRLIRDIDSMHFIMPIIYPNRCDNEAFISERIDLTAAERFLEEKNAANPEYKYTFFQLIVTALIKTVTLRPKMNRFIANKNIYQRNEVSASFVIKKQFEDESKEGLAFIHATDNTTLDEVHGEIYRQVTSCRGGKQDSTSDAMDMFKRMPRFLSKALINIICILDRHGKVPRSLIETDPYYSSIVLTNLGSIGMHSGYHHLTNWGTNSLFAAIGEKKERPFYDDDGTAHMRQSVDIGITIDERLADGYYYSKTVKLLKYLLENPKLLDRPAGEEVSYE
ncbi:MAG: 2-oxo acid dehydrogenase subunit E2 [Clostridia bacterium]|nr:2-oxo acid dehydrogenase subunit E2 [Clostridia bacterium]